jgi:hypothetical protein
VSRDDCLFASVLGFVAGTVVAGVAYDAGARGVMTSAVVIAIASAVAFVTVYDRRDSPWR